MHPWCRRMLKHNTSYKRSLLRVCENTQERPAPLIDKSGIEEMLGEGEVPEMKIHREVMRLRICLRWELMPSGLTWWMRTTLATEHNSAAHEAVKEDLLLMTYGITSVRGCRRVGCKPRAQVGCEGGARVQPYAHLADLLESIRGMSGRQQCVQLPPKHLATPETAHTGRVLWSPRYGGTDKCSCSD